MRFVAQTPGRACVYLLLTTVILGGAVFSLVEDKGDWIDGMWWAIVTLTTVGYGDVTTRTDLGHTLAVTEALVGQIYLVTVVALLVSSLGANRGAPRSG